MSFENELRNLFDEADTEVSLDDGSLTAVKMRAKQRTNRARMAVGAAAIALIAFGGILVSNIQREAANVELTDIPDDGSEGALEDGAEDTSESGVDGTVEGSDTGPVSEDDFSYAGAFLVPSSEVAIEGAERFDFGGSASAFNPFGDPDNTDGFAGSIFMTGFPRNAQVAEISIPEPAPHDGTTAGLPIAEMLQPFSDVTDGRADTFVGSEEVGGQGEFRIGGLEVLDGPGGQRLHWTAWQWQDVGAHDNPGHGHSSLDLSNPDPQGPWFLGDFEGYESAGYVFSVPENFANAELGGRELIAGFQDIEATFSSMSQGPPFFAFSPFEQAAAEERVAEPLELASYGDGDLVTNFSDTAATPGATWVSTSDGRSAVVTVGNDVLAPGDLSCSPGETQPVEGFGPRFTFYDPADLAAVASGERDSNQVEPYRVWDPTEHLIAFCGLQISSISFDADAGRIYVVQTRADVSQGEFGFLPVVHVFDVG